jgi:hypothetical protein
MLRDRDDNGHDSDDAEDDRDHALTNECRVSTVVFHDHSSGVELRHLQTVSSPRRFAWR